MSGDHKVAHEDAEAMWVSRISKHLMSAEPGLAQKVLAEAVAAGVTGRDIQRLQKLLGPPSVRVIPYRTNTDLSAVQRWFEKHGESYRGQWVAVLGEQLLAHAPTLEEVMNQLKSQPTPEPPLVHYLRPRPVR